MSSLLELLAVNGAATCTIMLLLWLVSIGLRDVSIIDAYWGFGFVVIAWIVFVLSGDVTPRKVLLVVVATLWGLRLTAYLARRKFGAPEDYRYRAMREQTGPRFWIASLWIVFGLQGAIMIVVALPLMTGQLDRSPLGWLDAVGSAVWAVGFAFEAVGDWQLARFKSETHDKNAVLDRGLWRYTRHPNYFGNFMIWWGIFLVSWGTGDAWWTVLSPLLMSFLLVKVSGVALLESSLRVRKAGYAEYVARTSAFFPWPPRPAHDSRTERQESKVTP